MNTSLNFPRKIKLQHRSKLEVRLQGQAHISYPSLHQILCANVDNSASNGLGRIEAECVIFISLPWVKNSFLIYCPLINGPRYSYIDQFAEKMNHQ